MPKEILIHILTFTNQSSVSTNLRSSCKKFNQQLLSTTTQYVIKAMPVSALETLSTRLNKATKPFELIVRSPTLALKELPNKFMNNLTGLKNLTGLDLTAWTYFPTSATKKICQMTFLQQLSSPDFSFNFANLSALTKLHIPGSIFVAAFKYSRL